MSRRIEWIDGLRGIACLGVFVYHFIRYVFPATYSGFLSDVKVCDMEMYLANNPLSIIVNGNFYVCLFFVISAFVLSMQVSKNNNKREIAMISLKRYPRLAIPVFIIGIISFIIGKLLLFVGIDAQIPAQNLSVFRLIKVLLFDTWFIGSQEVLSVFWMLSILFYGSFITIIIATIVSSVKKPYSIFILCVCSVFISMINMYYLSFSLGIFLQYIYENRKEQIERLRDSKSFKKYFLIIFILFIGILAGGYPSFLLYPLTDVNSFDSGVYEIFRIFPDTIYFSSHLFHIIGAGCILFLVMISNNLQKFLSFRLVQFVGKISFSLYIIHKLVLYLIFPIIFKYGTTAASYAMISLILFIISALVVVFSSWLFQKYIELPCNKLINKMVNRIFINH